MKSSLPSFVLRKSCFTAISVLFDKMPCAEGFQIRSIFTSNQIRPDFENDEVMGK